MIHPVPGRETASNSRVSSDTVAIPLGSDPRVAVCLSEAGWSTQPNATVETGGHPPVTESAPKTTDA